MKLSINGRSYEYDGDPERSLLDYLREELQITSVKSGCAPQGACGCCTVQLGSRAVLACLTPMAKAADQPVFTIEGFPPQIRDVLAHAFSVKGGIQCGFCSPGFLVRAKVLLSCHPDPSRDEVVKAINPNLCRCTGYVKIVEAILFAAEILRGGGDLPLIEQKGRIGDGLPKYTGIETALGRRPFVADLSEDGMLFAALRLSDHPRAVVQTIDLTTAKAMPGVVKILTATDVPGQRKGGLIVKDWPMMIAIGETTGYLGDILAIVVGETKEAARNAVAAIEVGYEVLSPVVDMEGALEETAAKVHSNGNLLYRETIVRGDVDAAFADASYISAGTFTTQRIEHGFMEPEACLAKPWSCADGPGVKVFSQGQGPYEDRHQIAAILGIAESRVNVVQVQNGGAFGGKEDLLIQGHAALAAFLIGKPVMLELDRSSSMLMHPKRHPIRMHYRLGCDERGRFSALEADILGDTGAYASVGMKVLERALGHASGAYVVPNLKIKCAAVYTNNVPCGAMRGFGVPQTAFAMERCIDDLCEKGSFDRWQIRYDNAICEGGMTATGQVIRAAAGVRPTLLALRDEFKAAKYAGIACAIKNTGIGNGMADIGRAKIVIAAADRVVIHHGWTEMGQGVHTVAIQVLHEETGIDPTIVEVKVDTTAETVCGMTTSSRGTSLIGHALIAACRGLKADLQGNSLAALVGKSYTGEWICDFTTKPGKEKPGQEAITHYSYGYATQVVVLNDAGKIETIYAAHDAGKVMNRMLFEGQIEGAIHMGLGYALSEDYPMKNARPSIDKFGRLGILRAKQMPKVIVKAIEVADPHGPYGAKGLGEIGMVPTAAAVVNALCRYDGKVRNTLPLNEIHILG